MSELSPRAKELLDAARRVPCAPDEATIRRMERTVLIAGGTTALALGGLKAASGGLGGLASKSAMAAVALAIVGTTAAVTAAVVRAEFVQPARRAAPARVMPQPSVAAPAPVVIPQPAVAPAPETTPELSPAPRQKESVVRPRALPVAPVIERETELAPSPLAAELALLRTAKKELDATHWAAALEALARHDSEFPEGALRVEAEVIRILAWCGQGRAGDAMQRAFELRTKTPNSPAMARLEGSCVDL
jgi:hypothetical protein